PTRLANARVDPCASVARTATLRVCPTSFAPATWPLVPTPWRRRQWRPIVSHRYHWYDSRTLPAPDQAPGETARRLPCVALPVTAGLVVTTGGEAAAPPPSARSARISADTQRVTHANRKIVILTG